MTATPPHGFRPPEETMPQHRIDDSPAEGYPLHSRRNGDAPVDEHALAAALVALRKEHEERYGALADAALAQADGQRELTKEVRALRGEAASTGRDIAHLTGAVAGTNARMGELTLEVRHALSQQAKTSGDQGTAIASMRPRLQSVHEETVKLRRGVNLGRVAIWTAKAFGTACAFAYVLERHFPKILAALGGH